MWLACLVAQVCPHLWQHVAPGGILQYLASLAGAPSRKELELMVVGGAMAWLASSVGLCTQDWQGRRWPWLL